MSDNSFGSEILHGASTSTYEFESVTVNNKGEIIERIPGRARSFREDLGNGICLDLVYIAGDKMLMGSPASEYKTHWSQGREEPQHIVTVPPFWIGKYAVTQEQWEALGEKNPARFKGDKHPVEQVSWNDCQAFCQKLSEQTGKRFDLPTETQWEYACRAGTTTPFHYGETITTELANYDGNDIYAEENNEQFRKETIKVGSFPPNRYGLYDMHGNVWEWCKDRWHNNYQGAPIDGSAWNEEQLKTSGRVMRGGSWHSHPIYCRSANRFHCLPDFVISYLGFRLVCLIED